MQFIGAGIGLREYLRGAEDRIISRGAGQGLTDLYLQFLTERLQPPEQTASFRRQQTALREGLRRQTLAGRQQISETAQARGFLDSGEVLSGFQDLRRAELAGFASGTAQILESLEARRGLGVMPFLHLAVGEQQEEQRLRAVRAGQAISSLQGGGANIGTLASGVRGG
jgi:hypothetical protein